MKVRSLILAFGVIAANIAHAQHTEFNATVDSNLLNDDNWSNLTPSNGNTTAFINVDADAPAFAQNSLWTAGCVTTIRSNATVRFPQDTGAAGLGTLVVSNGTIIATDDVFVENGTIILLEGSSATAGDDFEANNREGQIYIHGGTHASGPDPANWFGAQGNANKVGCGIHMTGGQITAGDFRFQLNSSSDISGTAVLKSASSATTINDDAGTLDFGADWSGSWEVLSHSGDDWKNKLAAGIWTLDGNPITINTFDTDFKVSPDGTTLSLQNPTGNEPEPIGDITINVISSSEAEISWTAVGGQSYDVQNDQDLALDPTWQTYTNVTGVEGDMTVTVPATTNQTFYRVYSE